jgi:hypothetical protein
VSLECCAETVIGEIGVGEHRSQRLNRLFQQAEKKVLRINRRGA